MTPPHVERLGRTNRSMALLALLLVALLGFGIATQVRSTAAGDNLATLRPDDLVQILDGLQQREDDLNGEVRTLQETLTRLRAGGVSSGQALVEARRQAAQLGILTGVVPATGPGVRIRIGDPARAVAPEVMLDAVQELRNAGAEAIEVGPVRIGVNSAFSGTGAELMLDGQALGRPIEILAIGDPPTLSAAMAIPGGVVDSVRRTGATIDVVQADSLVITALRVPQPPQYARPAG